MLSTQIQKSSVRRKLKAFRRILSTTKKKQVENPEFTIALMIRAAVFMFVVFDFHEKAFIFFAFCYPVTTNMKMAFYFYGPHFRFRPAHFHRL